MTKNTPSWNSIIGDEATDVAKREQFNLTIRWLNNDYDIAEDPIGLYCLPNLQLIHCIRSLKTY